MLSDEEIWKCLPEHPDNMGFARAIEAKVREATLEEAEAVAFGSSEVAENIRKRIRALKTGRRYERN